MNFSSRCDVSEQEAWNTVITQIPALSNNVKNVVQALKQKVDRGSLGTNKGISFLEMKLHLLLNYLIELCSIMLHKVQGQPIKGSPAIEQLVETRTLIERIRPIDQRLKYQIDKMVKIAATGVIEKNDPLYLKPKPENLVSKIDSSCDTEEDEKPVSDKKEEKEDTAKTKKYVPPKLAAVHYEEESAKERQEKLLARAKKRALSSSLIRELRQEYYDEPEEIRDSHDFAQRRLQQEKKHRTEYEEEYMTRVTITKRQRNEERRIAAMSSLGRQLTRFGDLSALNTNDDINLDELDSNKHKKRKTPAGSSRTKRKTKKRKFK